MSSETEAMRKISSWNCSNMGENPYFSIDFYKVKMGFSFIAIPSFLISVCITGTIL